MNIPDVHHLIEQLDSADEHTSEAALVDLVAYGEDAVPALIDALYEEPLTGTQQHQIALALSRIGTPDVVDWLLHQLDRDNAPPYLAAAFDEVTNPAAYDVLVSHLESGSDLKRQLIAGALGRLEDRRAIEVLQWLLGDASQWVRYSAAWALGNIRSAVATRILLDALQSDDSQLRTLVVTALQNHLSSSLPDHLEAMLGDDDPVVRQEASVALQNHLSSSLPQRISSLLVDPDPGVRREASAALVQLGSNACEFVIPLLKNDHTSTRELAALVMRWISDRRGVDALVGALDDESPYVRNQAARTLGRLRDRSAILPLRQVYDADPDERIRQTAEISLRKLGVQLAD